MELAVMDSNGETLLDTMIRPASPIPYPVTWIHGINNEMVADAPTWRDVYDDVHAILCGRTIFAYNSRFDSRMIGQTCAICNLPPIPANWCCAMRLCMEFAGNRKWISLLKAAWACGITLPDQVHRASRYR